MRIRKIVAGVGLTIGLTGAGVVAAAPSLITGSTSAAGLPPTICIDDRFCEPITPPKITITPTTVRPADG